MIGDGGGQRRAEGGERVTEEGGGAMRDIRGEKGCQRGAKGD